MTNATRFKKGDKVTLKDNYQFKHQQVGIGTIVDSARDGWWRIKWENNNVDGYEEKGILLLYNKKTKRTTGKIVQYKPGLSIKEYVKNLLKMEKDKERIKWLRTFDNCVLPKSVRNTIDEALTIVLRSEMFDKWGINEHFEKGLTNSILIYGPPGTGKTMVSESIAAILGMNLMKLTNADIQSNIPGQTEKNMTDSFKKAKSEDALIMLDECDSMLYNRDAVGAIMSAEINHLLTEIENFSGIVILTTNRLHKLDKALQRRIIAKIELPFPDKPTRKEIWKKLIPRKMPVRKLNFNELSDAMISGGEIKNAIILSARKAIAQNRNIVEMTDFRVSIVNIIKSKEDFESVQPNMVDTGMYDKIKRQI
ncbi:MAG TPA: AAA family ATPase [Candidatus Aminicenantes bacterium]|nr:AAA family ATPase [Candidatus Aminicenantes bacterium]